MSESNRISQLLSAARQCDIQRAIKEAKAIGRPCDADGCGGVQPIPKFFTPLESDNLYFTVKNKLTDVKGRTIGPESTRIQTVMLSAYDNSVSQFNSFTRFAQYAPRVVIPACVPVPLIDRNANLPKASTRCSLPNKPYFPTLS